MWRQGRIGIVSERGRGRSREQATTTTTAAGEPLAGVAFLVEDMECRQTDLGNFLLAQRNFVSHSCVARQRIRCWRTAGSVCSARQRQRQPGRPQNRHGFAPTLCLRSLLRARHVESPGQIIRVTAVPRLRAAPGYAWRAANAMGHRKSNADTGYPAARRRLDWCHRVPISR
jgi:hypothetical protein